MRCVYVHVPVCMYVCVCMSLYENHVCISASMLRIFFYTTTTTHARFIRRRRRAKARARPNKTHACTQVRASERTSKRTNERAAAMPPHTHNCKNCCSQCPPPLQFFIFFHDIWLKCSFCQTCAFKDHQPYKTKYPP